jgi:NTP pyrophosphatase (non-canonical NTP hydrolase)
LRNLRRSINKHLAWVRNNEHGEPLSELEQEIGDAYMMLLVFAKQYHIDPERAMLRKMASKGYNPLEGM